jgi:hypothetical protein
MTPQQRDKLVTTLRAQDLFCAIHNAWGDLWEETPSRDAIVLVVAHSALETGWWQKCYNFNLGNVKSSRGDGRDWTYYSCSEVLEVLAAEAYVRGVTDGTARIMRYRGDGKCEVAFVPPHPVSRFRAYETLDLAAVDHLTLLRKRFAATWPYVVAGDAPGFCRGLKQQGYFTADLGPYQTAVVSIHRALQKQLVDVDPAGLNTLPRAQRQAVAAAVAVSLAQLACEELAEPPRGDPDT